MTINTATLEINLRPIRLGFLVNPVDRRTLSEVARVATCQWGGIACPMIPVMDAFPPAWCEANLPNPDPNELTLSLLRYFEPDLLVETCAGQLDRVDPNWDSLAVGLLLLGKVIASALSLGAGFRGGLFSSSLLIGCLLGALIVQMLTVFAPGVEIARIPAMMVGMAAVGAAITGAPLTMVFLVLEISGSFMFGIGVLTSAFIASTLVRLTFGYSFSTWRFHLRGIPLLGAHDVGWVRDLTARRLMRTDFRPVALGRPLIRLREELPLGSRKYAFAVDQQGRYAGIVDIATLHDPELNELAEILVAADCVIGADKFVRREDNIQIVLEKFSAAQLEILPVVDDAGRLGIVGAVTEAYCLKRYAQELDNRRSDEIGAP
ncbi:chloride channel protein [Paracoccus methylarcula]|uniref:Chloride channel protein n=1 Tax=Paracoccus methylarcula TaxID=72022 RepID=A0A422QWK6_9RHOB|nr:chloride channel protein [Paracoccus methylarcula]RNF34320.1 chloride channel protein [Paracoccus methylarcula]